jgi:hypothetical protein
MKLFNIYFITKNEKRKTKNEKRKTKKKRKRKCKKVEAKVRAKKIKECSFTFFDKLSSTFALSLSLCDPLTMKGNISFV